ncbi:hypothetical protein PVNG_06516 [Plasmodium vivax North Korean]|uniref:Uncharacterized protein n=1 Tax=Plasmodium vivax North Korean TaxID=1035514 RepID=A0A0J9WE84_PLAVI|nr:hypothetical protein PVNG_06516 [Plasmodium vivax North Korean]
MCQIRAGGKCKKKHNLYDKPLTCSYPPGQDRDPYNYDVKCDEKEHLTLTLRTPKNVLYFYKSKIGFKKAVKIFKKYKSILNDYILSCINHKRIAQDIKS